MSLFWNYATLTWLASLTVSGFLLLLNHVTLATLFGNDHRRIFCCSYFGSWLLPWLNVIIQQFTYKTNFYFYSFFNTLRFRRPIKFEEICWHVLYHFVISHYSCDGQRHTYTHTTQTIMLFRETFTFSLRKSSQCCLFHSQVTSPFALLSHLDYSNHQIDDIKQS